MPDTVAYKVMTAVDVAALGTGVFTGAPIDVADGFIHLSTAAQLTETVTRHFSGQRDLTILAIDLSALAGLVRWEPSRDAQLFPHLYGPLPAQAVIGECALAWEADGTVRLPRLARPGAQAFDRVNVVTNPLAGLGPGLSRDAAPRRVFVLGATGTIGRATVRALTQRGHEVVCYVRPRAGVGGGLAPDDSMHLLAGAVVRFGEIGNIARDGFAGGLFDVLVSCMASRTGAPADAWAIDYQAHVLALEAARAAGVSQVVLLSAICVQKPLLEFQRAKLAFEQVLRESGLIHSIVRPTAFFKSLSGQIERVKRGKPFLVFGDGTLTACKPISDDDLGAYLADCLHDDSRWNRVLPIGGPGDAITPLQQGEHLFALLATPPRIRHVPVALLDVIIFVLSAFGRIVPALRAKAELARIGRYYATESMLVLNAETGRYDAAATPSTGTERLFDFYAGLVGGANAPERGDHAIF